MTTRVRETGRTYDADIAADFPSMSMPAGFEGVVEPRELALDAMPPDGS